MDLGRRRLCVWTRRWQTVTVLTCIQMFSIFRNPAKKEVAAAAKPHELTEEHRERTLKGLRERSCLERRWERERWKREEFPIIICKYNAKAPWPRVCWGDYLKLFEPQIITSRKPDDWLTPLKKRRAPIKFKVLKLKYFLHFNNTFNDVFRWNYDDIIGLQRRVRVTRFLKFDCLFVLWFLCKPYIRLLPKIKAPVLI